MRPREYENRVKHTEVDKIQDIGKFKTYRKELDLHADRKRFWPERMTTVRSELCVGSMPLDVNLDGRPYTKESGLSFYAEQVDYDPYDNEDLTESLQLLTLTGYFEFFS